MKNRLLLALLFSIGCLGYSFAQSGVNMHKYKGITRQALRLYQQKDFSDALSKYEEAFELKNDDRIDLYNAACCASLIDDYEKAYLYLSGSIENGYIDKEWLTGDSDFSGFSKSKKWEKILKQIDEKKEFIRNDFERVKDIPLKNLIPYKEKTKWGYLNKENNQVIVDAKYEKTFFAGSCLKIELTKNNFINVDESGLISIYKPKRRPIPPPLPPGGGFSGTPKVDSAENFRGFRVNQRGRITHVSGIYDATEWEFIDVAAPSAPQIEILGPFKIDEEWHAVVQLNNKWGVINENGEVLKEVPFQYEELIPTTKFEGKEIWFYFKDTTGINGFINSNGEVRFYNEFENYPFVSSNKMKLIETRKGNLNGVIDLANMEWLLEPIGLNILGIEYTHNGDCNKRVIRDKDRPMVDSFYFWVRDSENNEYYIGEQKEVYRKE